MRSDRPGFFFIRGVGYALALVTSACGVLDSPAPTAGGSLTADPSSYATQLRPDFPQCVEQSLGNLDSRVFLTSSQVEVQSMYPILREIGFDLRTWGTEPSPLFIDVAAQSISALERAELLGPDRLFSPDRKSSWKRPCDGFSQDDWGYRDCARERLLLLPGQGGTVSRVYPVKAGIARQLGGAVTKLGVALADLRVGQVTVDDVHIGEAGHEAKTCPAVGSDCTYEIRVRREQGADLRVTLFHKRNAPSQSTLLLLVTDGEFSSRLNVMPTTEDGNLVERGACSGSEPCGATYKFSYPLADGKRPLELAQLEIGYASWPEEQGRPSDEQNTLMVSLTGMHNSRLRVEVLTRVLTRLIDRGFPELEYRICGPDAP